MANSSFWNSFSVNGDAVSSSFRNYLILCLAQLLLELCLRSYLLTPHALVVSIAFQRVDGHACQQYGQFLSVVLKSCCFLDCQDCSHNVLFFFFARFSFCFCQYSQTVLFGTLSLLMVTTCSVLLGTTSSCVLHDCCWSYLLTRHALVVSIAFQHVDGRACQQYCHHVSFRFFPPTALRLFFWNSSFGNFTSWSGDVA